MEYWNPKFQSITKGFAHKIEIWEPDVCGRKLEVVELQTTIDQIEEPDVHQWFRSTPPLLNDAKPRTGLRLLMVKNQSGYPDLKFPMGEETLNSLLDEWKFPPLDEFLDALCTGGSAVFKPSSKDCKKISMAKFL